MNQNEWELPLSQGSGSLDDWAIPSQPQPGAQFGAQLGAQPTQPASGGGNGGKASGKRKLVIALAAAVVLALIGGITVFVTTGGKTIAAMSYVSVDDPGPNPFMQSTTDKSVSTLVSDGDLAVAETSGAVDGSDPNLYGGSGQLSVCDANALVSNLKQDSMLNAAFAAGIGINAEDVEQFVLSLKSVVLRQDTWVTNHGYADGKPTPYQAVLQRGTAVMVDSWGVPRVRCSCGNPLAEAWNGYTAPSNASSSWDGYDSAKVATVYGGNEQSSELSVADISTGAKEKVRIDDAELKAQKDAVNSVTADTPRTMPKDMGVKPDEKLLDELGIPVAKYDDKQRPTGGERFNEKVGAGGSGGVGAPGASGAGDSNFPDWKSQVTPVDAEKFTITKHMYGDYFIPFPELKVGCFIDSEGGGALCFSQSLRDTGVTVGPYFRTGSSENGTLRALQLNFIQSVAGNYPFIPIGKELDTPLNPYRHVPPLEVGQSVQIGDNVCFNIGDSVGCENAKGKFYVDDQDGVYLNGSEQPIGAVCGDVYSRNSGQRYSVVVSGGPVDCGDAIKGATEFLQKAPSGGSGDVVPVNLENWSCYLGLQLSRDDGHVLGSCRSLGELLGDFQIWRK